jgi:hypothetical protein
MEAAGKNAIKVFVTPLNAMVTSYNLGGRKVLKEVVVEGVPNRVHSLRILHSDVDPWRFNIVFSHEGVTLVSSKTGLHTIPEVSSSGWIPAYVESSEPISGNYVSIPSLGLWIPISLAEESHAT